MAFLFNQSVCCKVVRCLVKIFLSQPDLLLVSGQALGIIFRTELSRTVCTTRAMSKSGGGYSHFPRLLSCVSLLSSLSSVNSFHLIISLKICLTISLVSSSHALTSSARIPLLSWDLPLFEFVECGSQLFCRNLWNSCRLFGIVVVHDCVAVVVIIIHFMFRVVFLVVLVKSSVELTKDVGNSFRSDAFPSVVFLNFVMSTFFFADLIHGIFRTPLKSSRILWMSCCLFNLFFL